MNPEIKSRYKSKADIMKALGHPTRLFIVDELTRGKRCVCELTEMVGDDISTVSRHLSVLKSAGIVADEKRSNQIFYSLRVPCVARFFSCVESVQKSSSARHAVEAAR
ncbi:MAG: metalloregulator ArsR/SmtB family transcription factor [Candidatus Aminicenantales bacterium]